jgi:hypothetical protein
MSTVYRKLNAIDEIMARVSKASKSSQNWAMGIAYGYSPDLITTELRLLIHKKGEAADSRNCMQHFAWTVIHAL